MHPFTARDELERRIGIILHIREEDGGGVRSIHPYLITSKDGDMLVTNHTPESGRRFPKKIYHRDHVWLMKVYEHDEVMEFLEVLRRCMVLEDLADV